MEDVSTVAGSNITAAAAARFAGLIARPDVASVAKITPFNGVIAIVAGKDAIVIVSLLLNPSDDVPKAALCPKAGSGCVGPLVEVVSV